MHARQLWSLPLKCPLKLLKMICTVSAGPLYSRRRVTVGFSTKVVPGTVRNPSPWTLYNVTGTGRGRVKPSPLSQRLWLVPHVWHSKHNHLFHRGCDQFPMSNTQNTITSFTEAVTDSLFLTLKTQSPLSQRLWPVPHVWHSKHNLSSHRDRKGKGEAVTSFTETVSGSPCLTLKTQSPLSQRLWPVPHV